MSGCIASIHRHPVKGFTPERLAAATLQAGGGFPCDRIYAVERGACGFDPAAPQHLSKWRFTVLANHARLARLVTTYDEHTGVIHVAPADAPEFAADLSRDDGRKAFTDWLTAFLGDDEDQPLNLIASGPAHRFTDDREGCVSLINLQSVRDLEARIGRRVDPLRLRANLYVEGWEAWREARTAPGERVRFGDVTMEVVKPIPRCVAVQVDPATGERDLDLLGALREHYGHVNCGLYLRVLDGGRLVEGEAVHLS